VSFPVKQHEAPDYLGNLIRCRIEREMACIEHMNFGLRHIAAIGLRFREARTSATKREDCAAGDASARLSGRPLCKR